MRSPGIFRRICKRAAALALGLLFSMATIFLPCGGIVHPAAAGADARPPYQFAIETAPFSGLDDKIRVFQDISLAEGEAFALAGWLATDEGVSGYEYLWVPEDSVSAEWQTVKDPQIIARKDLTGAGIPYRSGHDTAGFHFDIAPPPDTEAGYYNFFLRGLDGMGNPCDMIAALRIRYGNADVDNGSSRVVHFGRLAEAAASDKTLLRGEATVDAEAITLKTGGAVSLGTYNLAAFEQILITVETKGAADAAGRRAILGLKSDGDHTFGTPGEPYNMTDALVYAALPDRPGTLEMDIKACDQNGELWLTAYAEAAVKITEIKLVYNGHATDRVAAKVRFSDDLGTDYFGGANRVTLSGVDDQQLGEVLRIEVSEDTNDPYVYFYAERLLGSAGIRLSADDYSYLVLLARTPPTNVSGHACLYLCAGTIMAPTGASTHSFLAENDGEWHYYLLDLTENPTWSGLIHGWRFDIINANSLQGNYMDIASVQFFRTAEAAEAAARRDPSDEIAHAAGDPAIILDMSEEIADSDFTIDPDDMYIVEDESESESATSPVLSETDTSDKESAEGESEEDADVSASASDTTDASSTGGCTSVASSAVLLWIFAALLCAAKKKRFKTEEVFP